MRFDQSRIAIFERTWLDNLDLALHVTRSHLPAIVAWSLVGILPLALMNHVVLEWMHPSDFFEELSEGAVFQLFLMVMFEAPLGTALLTLYLGQMMFVQQPGKAQIVRDFFHCLPQLVLLQVILRAILIVPVITWIVPYGMWPFLNEVILLERNPLFGRRGQISTLKRNNVLHDGNSSDYMSRALAALCLAPILVCALWYTLVFLLSTLFGYEAGYFGQLVALQAVVWIVVVFFTVGRFLSYLDQRIRREGWEVELFLRAERERLTRKVA